VGLLFLFSIIIVLRFQNPFGLIHKSKGYLDTLLFVTSRKVEQFIFNGVFCVNKMQTKLAPNPLVIICSGLFFCFSLAVIALPKANFETFLWEYF